MNEDFISKMNRDFVNLKFALSDHKDIAEVLSIDSAISDKAINLLRTSTEMGHIEARKNLLKKIFVILEDGKFKAMNPAAIEESVKLSTQLLFLTAIDKRVTSGDLITPEQYKRTNMEEIKKLDLKYIITSVTTLTKEHDELENDKNVKAILIHLKEYNTELEKSKSLLRNIVEEKRKSFLQNVQNNLSEILFSIKKNYFNILKELEEEENRSKNTGNLLTQLDFRKLQPVLTKQLSSFSQLHSSFTYIKNDYYKVQPIIERMYNKLNENISLLEDEKKSLLSILDSHRFKSSELDNLIVSIKDMIIKIIDKKYKEEPPPVYDDYVE